MTDVERLTRLETQLEVIITEHKKIDTIRDEVSDLSKKILTLETKFDSRFDELGSSWIGPIRKMMIIVGFITATIIGSMFYAYKVFFDTDDDIARSTFIQKKEAPYER